MRAVLQPAVYRVQVRTGYGDAFVESKHADAAEFAARALLAHDRLLEDRENLLNACKALVDFSIWMSGSSSFSPGGEAHDGWMNLHGALDDGKAAIAKAENDF